MGKNNSWPHSLAQPVPPEALCPPLLTQSLLVWLTVVASFWDSGEGRPFQSYQVSNSQMLLKDTDTGVSSHGDD